MVIVPDCTHLDDGHCALKPLAPEPDHARKQGGQEHQKQAEQPETGGTPPRAFDPALASPVADCAERADKGPPRADEETSWYKRGSGREDGSDSVFQEEEKGEREGQ